MKFPLRFFIAEADPGFLPTTSLVRANGTFFGGHHQTSVLRPFVKDFEALVQWTSNFWNQLVHTEIYLSTIIKE